MKNLKLHLVGFLLGCLSVLHAQQPASRSVLYSSAGAELTRYEVNAAGAALVKKETIHLPAAVQYAWPSPSRKYFYIAWSDGGAAGAPPGATVVPVGKNHGLSAFRIDPSTGALQPIGQPVKIQSRPIHCTVDAAGANLLVAFNDPSAIAVYRLNGDGTIGEMVKQSAPLDAGIYAHQVRANPSGKTVFMVTRGNGPTKDKPEDRGALKIYSYSNGELKNLASIAPNGGVNFQPRHLDFHPSKPWVYVSLERQSKLQVYHMAANGSLDPPPLFTVDSPANVGRTTARQNAGTLHVDAAGKFIYQANRAAAPDKNGRPVIGDGENSIAVYAIDQQTGEPKRIQNADTHGAEPRTFALDASGRILVAGNQSAAYPDSSANAKMISASLALFRVGGDGKLSFVRAYDVDNKPGPLFWMGMIPLP